MDPEEYQVWRRRIWQADSQGMLTGLYLALIDLPSTTERNELLQLWGLVRRRVALGRPPLSPLPPGD